MNPPAAAPAVQNLRLIAGRLAEAVAQAGRPEGSVELVAVSKFFDADAVRPVLEAGHRVFGENRVQEAAAKWPALREAFPGIELHLIGPLQSNKAADAVRVFDVIETVDREKIAASLAKEVHGQNRRPRFLVQVDIGEEAQKAGIPPREAVAFVRRCREVHGLGIDGLMCIPPVDEAPGPFFALLQALGAEAGVRELSMGMSNDFERAVPFGATAVRVGSAIFGARPAPAA